MASNDAIVLRANFSEWKRDRASGLNEVDPWVYYCIFQFLKPYELNDEEVLYGLTEGGNDGGADGLYFVVNHRILVRDDADIDPKSVTSARVIVVQVKESGGFKPTEIDKHIEFANDLLDLSKPASSLSFRYNENVIKQMAVFKEIFLKISGNFPSVDVDFYYITGDDVSPDTYAVDSSERVIAKVAGHLSRAKCTYRFVGAQQLWDQVQKRPPRSKILRWAGTPMETKNGYVGLVNLFTYYEFLQDEPGILAERIFESNVRGYQRDTTVNTQIRASLERRDDASADFWILNNGITMLATNTGSAGHLALNVSDPQIVNGLQTSREIFNYFNRPHENGGSPSIDDRMDDTRSVIVRVIKINDPAIEDLVIRSTNSQNQMPPASLRMTDQIHRDVEEIFKHYDLYYDRRKGFYRDQAKPINKIITVNALAQAMISIILQRPDDARARPGDYFKDQRRYESIFGNAKIPLPVYVKCISIVRRVEAYLVHQKVRSADAKNIKYHMATDLSCELSKLSRPWPAKILDIQDPTGIDDAVLLASFGRVNRIYQRLSRNEERDAVARGSEFVDSLLAEIRKKYPRIMKRRVLLS